MRPIGYSGRPGGIASPLESPALQSTDPSTLWSTPMRLHFRAAPWYTSAYRRAVIDMHIPDWNDAFLSQFDPERYVAMLVQAKAQSIVAYAMSHTGLFN